VGAAVRGFIGVHLSHRYLAHPKVFTVAAIIPMIPGVQAYKAMIAIVQIHHYGFSDALFEQMIAFLYQHHLYSRRVGFRLGITRLTVLSGKTCGIVTAL